MDKWFAIVFNQDAPEGVHPDPHQHWSKGQVFSVGSVIDRDSLPSHFDIVELPANWDSKSYDDQRTLIADIEKARA